jgi:hypothetical protein
VGPLIVQLNSPVEDAAQKNRNPLLPVILGVAGLIGNRYDILQKRAPLE